MPFCLTIVTEYRKKVVGFGSSHLREIWEPVIVDFLEDARIADCVVVNRPGLDEVDIVRNIRAWLTVRNVGERTYQGKVPCHRVCLVERCARRLNGVLVERSCTVQSNLVPVIVYIAGIRRGLWKRVCQLSLSGLECGVSEVRTQLSRLSGQLPGYRSRQ